MGHKTDIRPGAKGKLTKAEIDRYFELEEERKALARQSKDLQALQDALYEKMFAAVQVKGGDERALVTCGYRLAIVQKNGTVAWKQEFVKAAGSAAAEALIASAPKKDELLVERAK